MRLALAEAAELADGQLLCPAGEGGRLLAGVGCDSRAVQPGDLFVAIPGRRVDGHDFVGQAVARGAAAAMVSRLPVGLAPALILVEDTVAALGRLAAGWRRRLDPTVVAVTGSVGKTTTKDLTAAVLGRRFPVLRSEGNLNTEVGVPLTLLRLEERHRVAVLEMAMRGEGQIAYLAALARPRVGVLTVVGEAHIELLGSREAIARAKGELLEALPPGGLAVLNADDPWQRRLAARTRARVVWYGLGPGAGVRAADLEERGVAGVSFTLLAGDEPPVRVRLPWPGRHHVADALAAAAVGVSLGVPAAEAAAALEGARLSGMRWEVTRAGGITVVDDSYNASPASMLAALEALSRAGGRRVAVLGDMLELGSSAEEGHRRVGRAAAAACDLLVAVGDLAAVLAEEAVAAGLPRDRVHRCPTAAEAAELVQTLVEPGDVVLCKGSRAMELDRVAAALRRAAAPC